MSWHASAAVVTDQVCGRMAQAAGLATTSASGRIEHLEPRQLLAVDFSGGAGPTSGLAQPASIVADFDGDGDGDIATTTGSGADILRIYLNTGTNAFTLSNSYDASSANVGTLTKGMLSLDVDNDGDIDLITNGARLWRNNGNGAFADDDLLPSTFVSRDIIVFNYDNDNLPDLMVVQSTGRIAISRNVGNGNFVAGPSVNWDNDAVFIGKAFNPSPTAGGREDVYAYNPTTREVRRIVNPSGTTITLAVVATNIAEAPQVMLWNSDVVPDLISIEGATQQRNVVVRQGTRDITGAITFGSAAEVRRRVNFDYSRLAAPADIDADGNLDIVCFRENSSVREWVALLGNPGSDGNFDGLVARITTIAVAGDPGEMLLGRVNNDARADALRRSGNNVNAFISGTSVEINTFTAAGPNGSSQPTVPGQILALNSSLTGGNNLTNLVTFYVDSNGNGRFDENDRGLGQATNSSGYDTTSVLPDGLPTGSVKLFAVATFATGLSSVREVSSTLWTRVFYPEGFRTLGNVNEHIPLINPNSSNVDYRIILRYETGVRDQVYVEGVIPPNARWGTTTSLREWTFEQTEGNAPVRTGVGYAIEVQSSMPIGAQLARYDTFGDDRAGPGTGESMSNVTATQWGVAEVSQRNFDFILFYNPFPVVANITLRFIDSVGSETIITRTAGQFGRSGIAVQEEPSLNPLTTYAVLISSDQPIATSHTRYRVGNGRGFTNLAQALDPQGVAAASTSFVVPSVEFRPGVTNEAFLMNPSETTAISVSVLGRYEGTAQLTANTYVLQPRARRSVQLGLLAPAGATTGSFRITSDNGPVIVSAETVDPLREDSNATTTAGFASRSWGFSDGYLSRDSLGNLFQEYVSLFNPNTTAIEVVFRFMDSDGLVTQATFLVQPESERTIALHTVPELINRTRLNWFSTQVSSEALFIASLTHWDLSQPGGWTTIGSPLAPLFPIPSLPPTTISV